MTQANLLGIKFCFYVKTFFPFLSCLNMKDNHEDKTESKTVSARIRKAECKDSTTFYNLDKRVINVDLFKRSCDIKIAVILT